MAKHWLSFVTLVTIVLSTSSCSLSQFTRIEPEVVYTTDGPAVRNSPIGQVVGEAFLSSTGPEVYWLSGNNDRSYHGYSNRGDHELASNTFDLQQSRLTSGQYRTGIRLVVIPRGIVRTISVKPINHSKKVNGPSEGSNWTWWTPNHHDGTWRGYKLQIQYQNTEDISEYEYWVLSSPSRYITSP